MLKHMNAVKLGDVVKGRARAGGDEATILVDRLTNFMEGDPNIYSVSGRIISDGGRLARKRAVVVHSLPWVVLEGYELAAGKSLTGLMRELSPQEEVFVPIASAHPNVVRSSAGRLSTDLARKYRVNRTDDGCRVTRLE